MNWTAEGAVGIGATCLALTLAATAGAACQGGERARTPSAAGAHAFVDGTEVGQTYELEGVVRGNDLGCHHDLPCSLRLATNDPAGEVVVIYHYGEYPPCPNEAASRAGEALSGGQRVHVRGRVQKLRPATLSTCADPAYSITPTEPRKQ